MQCSFNLVVLSFGRVQYYQDKTRIAHNSLFTKPSHRLSIHPAVINKQRRPALAVPSSATDKA